MLTTDPETDALQDEPNEQFQKSMIGVCERCGTDGEFDVKWYEVKDNVSGSTRECYLCVHCAHEGAAVCPCMPCSRNRRSDPVVEKMTSERPEELKKWFGSDDQGKELIAEVERQRERIKELENLPGVSPG